MECYRSAHTHRDTRRQRWSRLSSGSWSTLLMSLPIRYIEVHSETVIKRHTHTNLKTHKQYFSCSLFLWSLYYFLLSEHKERRGKDDSYGLASQTCCTTENILVSDSFTARICSACFFPCLRIINRSSLGQGVELFLHQAFDFILLLVIPLKKKKETIFSLHTICVLKGGPQSVDRWFEFVTAMQ